jgi:hypothetical protein
MSLEIRIAGQVMGSRRAQIPERPLQLSTDRQLGGEPLTLRDLITMIVLEEVEAFRQRQKERRLLRVLTEREIAEGIERGKIDPGGHEGQQQDVDPHEAVRVALQAFEDQLYFVFIDGVQQHHLDQPVHVQSGSQVLFVRLVPLAGG